jgi:amino acid adenylation domain-containing protein
MNDMLREDRQAEGAPRVADVASLLPDLAARHEPFPLTDVQKAYWIGRSGTFDLGHIGCHVYLEVKLAAHDGERLQAAWQMLIEHHDMLRAIVREDGRQQILAEVPRYNIEHRDLSGADPASAPAEVEAIRQRMSHQVFRPDRWPLFEVRTTDLDSGTLLHLSIDLLFMDFWSIQLLVKEYMLLVADPDPYLPPLDLSFRDYVLFTARQRESSAYRRAEDYWRKRLDTLPGPPQLPLAKQPADIARPYFVRRDLALDAETWRQLKERSAKAGVTPSIALTAAFARILGRWGGSRHFTLNLTQFQRAPVHLQVNRLIGDFTTILLLEIRDPGTDTFEMLAQRLGTQFWSDLEHAEYGGLRVLHELARSAGGGGTLAMPVVFTSALARALPGLEPVDDIGTIVHSVSQTPQVWLDHQVYEQRGRLHLSWDAVEQLFPAGLLDEMFSAYGTLLLRLARDENAWCETSESLSPDPKWVAMAAGESAGAAAEAKAAEIEAALREHPLVAEAAAMPAVTPDAGLVVYVTRRPVEESAVMHAPAAPWRNGPLVPPAVRQAAAHVPPELHAFVADLAKAESRGTATMAETLVALGLFCSTGETWSADEIVARCRVQPRYAGLIEHWLRFLAADGLLTERGGRYTAVLPLQLGAASAATETDGGEAELRAFFVACQRSAKALLRGEVNPLDLLFPGGDWSIAEALYEYNPMSRHVNALAASAVGDWAAATEGSLRVLEIGAGIGSATAALLRALPVERTRYLFTDVSAFFHPGARRKFAAFPFVQYGVLDALRDPLAQGFLPQSFDLIVAANVMHNAANPAAALARLRPLLADGGRLVLIEATRNTRAHAVSVGFIEGLSGVTDGDDGPFLPLPRWLDALDKAGFADACSIRDSGGAGADFGLDTIVACAPPLDEAARRRHADAARESVTSAALRAHLAIARPASPPADIVVVETMPLTCDGTVDRAALRSARPVGRPALPSGAFEQAVAAIWAQALGRDTVGVEENFFDLGGDSLIAVRIVASVRERFGVELRAQALFESPRVRDMTIAIERARRERPADDAAPAGLPALVPDPTAWTEPFPLTDIQQAYWIGRSGVLELGNVGAHFYLELQAGPLDRDRLERAWQRLIERHGMLRTVVLPDGRQRMLEPAPRYRIEMEDVTGLASDEAEAVLARERARMSHQVHLGEHWPPFEIRMTRLGPERTRLHVSLDLIMIDLWSFRLLMREWLLVYENPAAALPPLLLGFRDYVLAAAALEETEALRYWLDRLPELPPPPDLPLARAPSTVAHPRFRRRAETLGADHWQRIKERARSERLTPSAVLLTKFADVLGAWSRRQQFTINLTLFQRLPLHPQVNQIVGDFTSITLLAVDCAAADAFVARAHTLQAQLWRDLDHRHVSGVKVIREMARRRQGGIQPAMPVVFTSGLAQGMTELEALERLQGPNLGEVIYAVSQTPQVWLDHQVYEQDGRLHLAWDAVEDLFPPGMLDDMFETYVGALRQLATDESAWDGPRAILVPPAQLAERAAANDTAALVPSGLLHDRFFAQARQRPEQTAVVTTTRRLSYGEVAERADRLARRLCRLGAQPNRLIAIVMEKSWEQVVGALAVLKAGAAYLPVDPELPPERRKLLLDRGEVEIVLTQSCLAEQFEWPPDVHCIAVDRDEAEFGPNDITTATAAKPDDLAYVIFTSGSTGEPKGVMIKHRSALNTVVDLNERFGVGPDDRILALSSLGFDLSVYDLFGALAVGATVVMPHPSSRREPGDWAALMARERVTIWNSVPALLEMLVDYAGNGAALRDSALRLALLSGDWIPVTLPDRARALVPGLDVIGLGGATEASIWSIFHRPDASDRARSSIPYGRALRNQTMQVLNDAMEPCPVWVPGQIYIGGIGVASGYWRDEARTAAQFVTDSRSGERLYCTGDVGRFLPGGDIEFLGREDQQVKVHGYRIELGEIETTLERHPQVKAAAVVAVGERTRPKHLVAYVVIDGVLLDALKAHVQQALPAYMVPSVWHALDALPLTPNGKVDRAALPALKALPAPERAALLDTAAGGGDADMLGRINALIAEELGQPPLDPAQNLLAVGANSLDLVRIVGRLEKEFGVRPSFQEFFADPTVTALARLIAQRAGGSMISQASPAAPATTPRRTAEIVVDPAAREQLHREDRGIRTFAAAWGTLALPRTSANATNLDLPRRTVRRFLAEPVPLATLGAWLSNLGRTGINGSSKYAYGSAGGCYAVQTYVHAKQGGIAGCPAGTFYYHPVEHTLVPLTLGVELHPTVHEPFTNRPIFEQASFSLFFVNQPRAIEPIYGDLAWRFSVLEAGAMAQAIETAAPRFGIGVCPIGMLDFAAVRPLLHLDSDQELLHAHVGGLAAPADDADWEEGAV